MTILHGPVIRLRSCYVSDQRLHEFTDWLNGIKDAQTRIRLNKRLDKVQRGLLGDGDKSTQHADIAAAIALSKMLEE